jgi:hypothetical protein
MTEVKAKKKLQEVSQRWNQRITTDQILGIYKNSDKYTFERQTAILRQMFKSFILDFDKLAAQFEVDVKKNKKTAYDAFINFLCNLTLSPAKPQIAVKPTSASDSKLLTTTTKSDFESPALSSTRVDHSYKPDVVVSEVRFIIILIIIDINSH